MLDCFELEKTLPARDEVKIKETLKGSNENLRYKRGLTIRGIKDIEKQ